MGENGPPRMWANERDMHALVRVESGSVLRAWRRTMLRLLHGIARPPSRDTPPRGVGSATCTKKAKAQGVHWYRKSADQGDVRSQASLGFMYQVGQGVPRDYAQAVAWYRKAADQG